MGNILEAWCRLCLQVAPMGEMICLHSFGSRGYTVCSSGRALTTEKVAAKT
jgi:hypothetical protein